MRVPCEDCTRCSSAKRQWTPARIMCIGLSAKPNMIDLDVRSRTGKLIAEIEAKAGGDSWHKSNLVKRAPIGRNGKLRYPTHKEMRSCFGVLSLEIAAVAPEIIVCLGTMVSDFLLQQMGEGQRFSGFDSKMQYNRYKIGKFTMVPVHHPGYMVAYRQSIIREYVSHICEIVNSELSPNGGLPSV